MVSNFGKLRIVFVGIPDMAPVVLNSLLNKGFNITAVIPPDRYHETYNSFKDFVKFKGLKLLDFDNSPNDSDFIEKVKTLNADIGVVCSYNKLLSKEFLSTAKMGYINCHPSFLPKYRGAMPYFHIINNGETKSAITLHFMDEKFDTGDIVYQKEFLLTPFETMGTLFNRTNYMFCDALCEVLSKIEKGEKIETIKQDKVSDFPKSPRISGNFRLKWDKTASEINRLVRACNPFFNVYTTYKGVSFKIIKTRVIATDARKINNCEFEPGKIITADKDFLIVATKEDLLSLDIFQVGTWGIFNPSDFYYNFSPEIGEYLV